ncbi:MAG: hypothetical protein O3C40_20765 [Planctomycetota bacterium]|nr:hypothetical protein [Planctomycetota bacterium]
MKTVIRLPEVTVEMGVVRVANRTVRSGDFLNKRGVASLAAKLGVCSASCEFQTYRPVPTFPFPSMAFHIDGWGFTNLAIVESITRKIAALCSHLPHLQTRLPEGHFRRK